MRKTVLVVVAVVSLVASLAGPCLARLGPAFDYDQMAAEADLIVIAAPVAAKELQEVIDLPGVRLNNKPIRAVGLRTTLEVSVVFKGRVAKVDDDGQPDAKPTIVLHHYRLADPEEASVKNAPALLDFTPGDGWQYVMFLKRTDKGKTLEDAVYEPFSGQTDAGMSVEKLRIRRPADRIAVLRNGLRHGTPEEKENVLNVFMKEHLVELVPDVITAILDDTVSPRHGDTGWGRIHHQAATAMCKFAQRLDGKTQEERGRDTFSFFNDGGVGSEERRKEVHANWLEWWDKNVERALEYESGRQSAGR